MEDKAGCTPVSAAHQHTRHPQPVEHLAGVKRHRKNMPGLSSVISNTWLPRTTDTWEPMRKALYPVAHSGVMQAKEESEELTDKTRKAEDKVVATYGGGKKSPKAEKKARAPVDMLWNEYREVHNRPAKYKKIQLRLEHKKRKPKPLMKERKRKELDSELLNRAGS